MNNPIVQTVLTQLQFKNPKGFQAIQQFMNSGGNPQSFVMQMMGNFSPEQKEELFKQAKSYGCPDDILSKLQNMK